MAERKRTFTGTNISSSTDLPQGLQIPGTNAISLTSNIASTNIAPSTQVIADSAEDVNFVISHLEAPSDNVPTYVSRQYNNDSIVGNEIQAYAKIAGCNWTYYVKTLKVTIGRNTEFHLHNNDPTNPDLIDIDLGPSKVVSRKHASIVFNMDSRKWQLFVHGRNGLKVNGVRLNLSVNTPCDLNSGNIIDIGGTQMMFILPDSAPIIPNNFRQLLSNKRSKLNSGLKYSTSDSGSKSDSTNQVKAFQLQEGISNKTSTPIEQDYSKDDAKDLKPPYSYATMITQAILSNPQGVLSLSEIYDWISSHFAYYRHTKQGWQNSIRHNLSLNKAFEKVPRKPNEPGKGMKWQISESYRNEFLKKWEDGSLNKVRRGTSVSRQLQLHLIKNNALPKGRSPTLNEGNLPLNTMSISHQQTPSIHSNTMSSNHSHLSGALNNSAYSIPNLSPNKTSDIGLLATKNNSNSTLPSPIKNMSIAEINYLNNDSKLSSGLVSSINNTTTSDQIMRSISVGDKPEHQLQSLTSKDKGNGSGIERNNQYTLPPFKEPNDNLLTSPKKIFNRIDMMTPERNVQRPLLEPSSAQSVNSSPAIWNYVQFSTPLGPNNNNVSNNQQNIAENDKVAKIEIESPLKNRKGVEKLPDIKDIELTKEFKQL